MTDRGDQGVEGATRARRSGYGDRLLLLRLILVLGSISPLFILWAIRGSDLIPAIWLNGLAIFLFCVSNLALWLRLVIAKNHSDTKLISVGAAEDNRNHVIAYIFTILLPLYGLNNDEYRDLLALVAILVLIVFVFWAQNMHYISLVVAVRGYRVFTVYPADRNGDVLGNKSYSLITRRHYLRPTETILAYRLSGTVYWEAGNHAN